MKVEAKAVTRDGSKRRGGCCSSAASDFGPPDERVRTALAGISAVEWLEQLIQRLLHVSNWDELLAAS